MDLVEISPSANPPVCRILEFSKYYYQKERKLREAKKKQHIVQIKEIKYGPNTEEHDFNFKKKNGLKFLKAHNKVKFTVRFRGRQMAHKELGYNLLNRIVDELKDVAEVDQPAKAEKNYVSLIMAPRKDIDAILAKMEGVTLPVLDSEPEPDIDDEIDDDDDNSSVEE